MEVQWDRVVADWFDRSLPSPTPRRSRTAGLPGKADALIGMRRSGKTWLLLGEIARLVESQALPRSHVLYLSLEDERLTGVDAAQLGGMLDAWWRRTPAAATEPTWLVLDEVQNVPGWERFVRRVLDRGSPRVSVTGSSARLLAREIATSMRGRSLALEVLPFGLDEVLTHQGEAIPTVFPPGDAGRARLEHALDRYLEEGGFPEVIGLDPVDRYRILRDYVDVVLFRDVVERHAAGNVPALRRIVRRLASAPATQLSVHRFYNDLRSQGIAVSKDTLHSYFDFVEDAYLAFRVPILTTSDRVRSSNPVKTYPVDPGLARAFAASSEPGHLLETVVYLELRRRSGEISWMKTRSGFEVDFAIQRHDGLSLVQVCVDPQDPAVRDRELRALIEAMAETGLREAIVVTRLHEEDVTVAGGTVRFIPAWRWLLERPYSLQTFASATASQ